MSVFFHLRSGRPQTPSSQSKLSTPQVLQKLISTSPTKPTQKSSSPDPFDRVQLSSNGKPRLKPVLSRHRRSPTSSHLPVSPQISSKPSQKSLSVKIMKTVFKVQGKRSNTHLNKLPRVNTENFNEVDRQIVTPYFKQHPKSVERKEGGGEGRLKRKRNGRVLFFEHVRQVKAVNVSFGVKEGAEGNLGVKFLCF